MSVILSYGGGRQTVAICCLIARGVLPKPDRIVMADTGRENGSTWDYLEAHVKPLLAGVGLAVEIVPPSKTYPLHDGSGAPVIPVYTADGKLRAFCSGNWKRDRVNTFLRATGSKTGTKWIGFALDERRRAARLLASERSEWGDPRFPLIENMLTTADCVALVKVHGLPEPPHSSCWMCPNKGNAEWSLLSPAEFAAACDLDDELRAEDIERGGSGVYLHHSRVPLRLADLSSPEKPNVARQCGLGMCFV